MVANFSLAQVSRRRHCRNMALNGFFDTECFILLKISADLKVWVLSCVIFQTLSSQLYRIIKNSCSKCCIVVRSSWRIRFEALHSPNLRSMLCSTDSVLYLKSCAEKKWLEHQKPENQASSLILTAGCHLFKSPWVLKALLIPGTQASHAQLMETFILVLCMRQDFSVILLYMSTPRPNYKTPSVAGKNFKISSIMSMLTERNFRLPNKVRTHITLQMWS